MYKIKGKQKKVAKQKQLYLNSMKLEETLFKLVEAKLLSDDEMSKLGTFKEHYRVSEQLKGMFGNKWVKDHGHEFPHVKYYKFRSELIDKYSTK